MQIVAQLSILRGLWGSEVFFNIRMKMQGMVFGVWGLFGDLRFGVLGLKFGVWGLGFGVWGLESGVWGLGSGLCS